MSGSDATAPAGSGQQARPVGRPHGLGRLLGALDWRPKALWSRILIIFFLVTPLVFTVTYMWAMWDPTQYLQTTKLAVVNEDQGAPKEGETKNYGNQVVEGLSAADYLSFEQVSRDKADQGLITGEYLFVLDIPKDFSKDVLSVMEENPVQPAVTISYNDYNGSNQALLTSGLVPKIQEQVAASIAQGYSMEVLGGMNQLGDGLRRANDGAGQLEAGAGELDNGADQLVDGSTQLKDGTTRLKEGTTQLQDGANRLVDGSGQLSDGASQLQGGTAQLGDGASQIDDGVGQLTSMLIPLLQQIQQVVPALQPVVDFLHSIGQHGQAAQIEGLISKLSADNPGNMVAQLNKLKDGTAQMRYNLTDPSAPYLSGVNQLADGIHQLDDGAHQLQDGANQLADGANQLDDGTTQLSDGTSRLKDGTTRLGAGTQELHGKLSEGAKSAPNIKNVEGSARQAAVPVAFDEKNLHPVKTVVDVNDPTAKQVTGGVSLLLVVVIGFLLMALTSMLVPHVTGRWSRSRAGMPSLIAFLALSGINLITLAALCVVSVTLGWTPQSWSAIALVILLIATAAAASFQFFRALFGRFIGALFSLGMYAYGVLVFGGVWPQAITPGFIRFFHLTSPMTYARYAFIRATDGRWDSTFWFGIAGLLFFTLVPLALTVLIRMARVNGFAREQDELLLVEEDSFAAEAVHNYHPALVGAGAPAAEQTEVLPRYQDLEEEHLAGGERGANDSAGYEGSSGAATAEPPERDRLGRIRRHRRGEG